MPSVWSIEIGILITSCKWSNIIHIALPLTRSQCILHEVTMSLSAAQLRAARGLLGWSQSDLSASSKVGRATITDFEAGRRDPYPRTLDDLRAALEEAGVIFVEENGEGPGVRLRKNLAFEGLDAIAAHLGINVDEADEIIRSGKLASFVTHSGGPPCVTRSAMQEFTLRKRAAGDGT